MREETEENMKKLVMFAAIVMLALPLSLGCSRKAGNIVENADQDMLEQLEAEAEAEASGDMNMDG